MPKQGIDSLVLGPLDGFEIYPLLDQVIQGAHVSQLLHVLHREGHGPVHLRLCGESAQSKSACRTTYIRR